MRLASFCLFTAFALPTSATETPVSACIGTHFNEYHRIVSPHRSVSLARLQQWSNWCKQGYTAFKLAEATRPCYTQQISLIQQQAGGFIPITYEKSQQIKHYCHQQLWSEINPSSPLENLSLAHP